MCMGGGGGGGGNNAAADAAAQQARDESARQERISSGMGTINNLFTPYNDDYYNKLNSEYSSYYQPQLEDQLKMAKEKQTFNLANQGLSNSSQAGRASTDLSKAYQQSQQQILGGANDYSNKAKSSVEGVRNDLIAQLNASANPNSINQTALNRISITPVNSLTPLSNLFSDVTGVAANGVNSYQAGKSAITPQMYQNPQAFGQMGKTQGGGGNGVVVN